MRSVTASLLKARCDGETWRLDSLLGFTDLRTSSQYLIYLCAHHSLPSQLMVMPAPPQNLHGHDGCGHDACGPSVPHTSPFFTDVSPTGICRLPSLLLQSWAPELTAMDAERMSLFMRVHERLCPGARWSLRTWGYLKRQWKLSLKQRLVLRLVFLPFLER